jgi:hypothetical protein
MGYLGRNPAIGTQKLLDSFADQFDGAETIFDLRYNGLPTYPTLSASLIVSLGGVLQEPDQSYYVSSDKIVFSEPPLSGTECWVLLYSEFGAAKSGSPEQALSATGFPIGFEDPLSNSEFLFDAPTRVFTLRPKAPAAEFVVWNQGKRQAISATKTLELPDTTGLYLIYLDGFFELQWLTGPADFSTQTPVSYVYYNAATSLAPFIAEERHGVTMDHATHEYLHLTRGAVIANGFGLSDFTLGGDGSADAHAQVGLGNGVFYDEDLRISVAHSASPTPGTFEQVLTPAAQIPVFYKTNGAGEWQATDGSSVYPLLQGSARPAYNLFSGGTWTTPDVTSGRFFNIFVVATNNVSAPIIAILGQAEYTNLGGAEGGAFSSLNLANFPVIEFRPLWRLTYQTSDSYTNAPKARLRAVSDLRTRDLPSVPTGTIYHGDLSGLSSDDHTQYLHVENTRVGITADISTTGAITAAAFTGPLAGNASTATKLSSSRTFALTGDITGTVSSDLTSGASIATAIAAGAIVNADVNASAAIAGTKISPDFGSQTVDTSGLASLSNLMLAFAQRGASIGIPGQPLFGVGPAVTSTTPVGIGPHDYYPIDLLSGSFM